MLPFGYNYINTAVFYINTAVFAEQAARRLHFAKPVVWSTGFGRRKSAAKSGIAALDMPFVHKVFVSAFIHIFLFNRQISLPATKPSAPKTPAVNSRAFYLRVFSLFNKAQALCLDKQIFAFRKACLRRAIGAEVCFFSATSAFTPAHFASNGKSGAPTSKSP